jgi:hypothetical protein
LKWLDQYLSEPVTSQKKIRTNRGTWLMRELVWIAEAQGAGV